VSAVPANQINTAASQTKREISFQRNPRSNGRKKFPKLTKLFGEKNDLENFFPSKSKGPAQEDHRKKKQKRKDFHRRWSKKNQKAKCFAIKKRRSHGTKKNRSKNKKGKKQTAPISLENILEKHASRM